MIINMARVGRPGGKSSPSGWYRIVQRWFLMVFHFTRAKEGSQTIWNNKILNISRQNMPTFTRKSVKIHLKHWTVRAQPVMSSIFLRVHWLRPDCCCCWWWVALLAFFAASSALRCPSVRPSQSGAFALTSTQDKLIELIQIRKVNRIRIVHIALQLQNLATLLGTFSLEKKTNW